MQVATACEGGAVGGDSDHGQPLGAKEFHLGRQDAAALAELLGAQLVGAGRGTGDDVRDAEPVRRQLVLLVGGQEARGEAREVEDRPEAVARAGEVVARRGGEEARVDAAEEDAKTARDDGREDAVAGGGQLFGGQRIDPGE